MIGLFGPSFLFLGIIHKGPNIPLWILSWSGPFSLYLRGELEVSKSHHLHMPVVKGKQGLRQYAVGEGGVEARAYSNPYLQVISLWAQAPVLSRRAPTCSFLMSLGKQVSTRLLLGGYGDNPNPTSYWPPSLYICLRRSWPTCFTNPR